MPFDRILIVDDHLIIRKTMADALRAKRHSVVTVETIADAEKAIQRNNIDVVFLDVRLTDGNGVDLLERLSNMPDRPLVIMMSGHANIETAVECMRLGAFDFLVKPFDIEQVEAVFKKAQLLSRMMKVNRSLSTDVVKSFHFLGDSPVMIALKQLIHKVAPTEATVLISGENGTGKELVANDIYNLSSRSDGPFIKINCAAVSDTLMESEFFGHEKGAYTGATERREGRFELANGGTLLLDEISEIPPRLQAKLLRVLQEGEFERVGSCKTIKVNVRVLATTNRDMKKAVASGDFREDLYYRLNVFPLHIPPLRERTEDIPLLAETFLSRACKRYGHKIPGFAPETLEAMMRHPWSGNVRELQNCVERAVILSPGNSFIEPDALGLVPADPIARPAAAVAPAAVSEPAAPAKRSAEEDRAALPSLDELEKRHILHALTLTNGNRTHAAELLKISIRTLRNKLNEYKLGESAAA
ncbi:MAG: sigma-54 dependent transcriptional regulator [Chthoniobacteraceae bacterium]|nr:sigma-54 dependent transcriptional regulator [Chthoniobacteraceae bacterium]